MYFRGILFNKLRSGYGNTGYKSASADIPVRTESSGKLQPAEVSPGFYNRVRNALSHLAAVKRQINVKNKPWQEWGVNMNDRCRWRADQLVTLQAADCRKVLQDIVAQQIPAIMSYLSRDKWHVAKIVLSAVADEKLILKTTDWAQKRRPINIQVHQPVGVSFKHGYGKFVFDTVVLSLEPSPQSNTGGTIMLEMPQRISVIQRRNYFRIKVPQSLKVNVVLWHRSSKSQKNDVIQTKSQQESQRYCQCQLVDISAGGAQVVLGVGSPGLDETTSDNTRHRQSEPDFRMGQFIGLRFTPLPYEQPIMLHAQIRSILPAADNKSFFIGLQIVGLEASAEGREVLARLVEVVHRYYQMNQSGTKQPVRC